VGGICLNSILVLYEVKPITLVEGSTVFFETVVRLFCVGIEGNSTQSFESIEQSDLGDGFSVNITWGGKSDSFETATNFRILVRSLVLYFSINALI